MLGRKTGVRYAREFQSLQQAKTVDMIKQGPRTFHMLEQELKLEVWLSESLVMLKGEGAERSGGSG